MSSGGQRRVLAGRYELGEVVGRGGMSTVYRARDLSLDRIVAVKVALDPLLERDPVYAARFKREARAAAAISHPSAVTVFDAGADGPTRYIVMEYVEGASLAEVLREEKPLKPARAARIAEQVADALAAAHAAGIVHRDIKPGNVMIAEGGAAGAMAGAANERVKVLDFGIARTSEAANLTETASVLGTAPYMSPEQAMGHPADARSDIYSLGCVLYEMLTGKPPFMAEVPAAVLHQHVRVEPKSPREQNSAIPPALDALVLGMLAKDPANRPQTAGEVRDRLANFETATAPTRPLPAAQAGAATDPVQAGAPTAATEVLAAAAAAAPQMATVPQAATPAPQPTARTPRTPPPRRPGGAGPWAFLAVIALLLLGAAVAYALTTGGSSKSTSSGSAPAHSSSHAVTSSSSHSSSTPATSTSTPSSTSSSSTSATTTTPTTTASTPTTTASTPTTTAPGPPGQGGTPPGQAKKGKKGKK